MRGAGRLCGGPDGTHTRTRPPTDAVPLTEGPVPFAALLLITCFQLLRATSPCRLADTPRGLDCPGAIRVVTEGITMGQTVLDGAWRAGGMALRDPPKQAPRRDMGGRWYLYRSSEHVGSPL